jgi:hypothetical protein
MSSMVKRHSCKIWGSEKPCVVHGYKCDSPMLNVWCTLSHCAVTGPFFQEQTFRLPGHASQLCATHGTSSTKHFLSVWWCSSILEPGSVIISGRKVSRTTDWEGWTNFMVSSLPCHNPYRFFPLGLHKGMSFSCESW